MQEDNRLILVGVISAAHGIRGDVLVKSFTDPRENILALDVINANYIPIKLKKIRINANGTLVCKLTGSTDRNNAESLSGTKLFCLRSNMPSPSEDEYYIGDLKNLGVRSENGEHIGVIIDVVNFGASDIIEIKFKDDTEEMFPFTKELFPEIGKNYVVLSTAKGRQMAFNCGKK